MRYFWYMEQRRSDDHWYLINSTEGDIRHALAEFEKYANEKGIEPPDWRAYPQVFDPTIH